MTPFTPTRFTFRRSAIDCIRLLKAARQLAMATLTPIEGINALRFATKPATVMWQGCSAGAASQDLLSNAASSVAHCIQRISSVRVLGIAVATAVRQSTPAPVVAAGTSLQATAADG